MTTRVLTAALIAATALAAVPAQAKEPKFKHLSIKQELRAFDAGPEIRVRAEGNKWVAATSAKVYFHLRVRAEMKRGYVRIAYIGVPGLVEAQASEQYKTHANVWRIFYGSVTGLNNHVSVTGRGNRLGLATRNAVAACNNLRAQGKSTDRQHVITTRIPVQLTVYAMRIHRHNHATTSRRSARSTLNAKIVCLKAPPSRAKPFTVSKVTLRFTPNVVHAFCPKTITMKITFEANTKGVLRYRLRSEGQPATLGPVRTVHVVHKGGGNTYRRSVYVRLRFTKSRAKSYRIQVENGPRSNVASYRVQCRNGKAAG